MPSWALNARHNKCLAECANNKEQARTGIFGTAQRVVDVLLLPGC